MLKGAFAAILGNDNAARVAAEAFLNEIKKSRPHVVRWMFLAKSFSFLFF
jgi:hypothetical protein